MLQKNDGWQLLVKGGLANCSFWLPREGLRVILLAGNPVKRVASGPHLDIEFFERLSKTP